MGWFLTRESVKGGSKKKAASKKGGRLGGGTSAKWDPQRTMVGLQVLGWVALVMGMVVGWRYIEKGVTDYAKREWAREIYPEDVLLAGVPEWMLERENQWIIDEMCVAVAESVCPRNEELPNPLDGMRLQRAAGLVSDISWVDELTGLRRLKNGRILVEASYREPMALVPTMHGYRAVDSKGVVLPILLQEHQVRLYPQFPVISGVRSGYVEVGERWEDSSLMAGLSVAEVLRHENGSKMIDMVDVSEADNSGRTRVVLRTTAGFDIVWGKSPLEKQGIEVSTSEKVINMRKVLNDQMLRGLAQQGVKTVEIWSVNLKFDQSSYGIEMRGTGDIQNTLNRF
ncbi:hypothetical protein JD969_10435 [Planctomycetota bacterium]|nr:hypothetical protein JD969_10435 [Planctomycetota bacterium]